LRDKFPDYILSGNDNKTECAERANQFLGLTVKDNKTKFR